MASHTQPHMCSQHVPEVCSIHTICADPQRGPCAGHACSSCQCIQQAHHCCIMTRLFDTSLLPPCLCCSLCVCRHHLHRQVRWQGAPDTQPGHVMIQSACEQQRSHLPACQHTPHCPYQSSAHSVHIGCCAAAGTWCVGQTAPHCTCRCRRWRARTSSARPRTVL